MPFDVAAHECELRGGHLASVANEDAFDLVKQAVATLPVQHVGAGSQPQCTGDGCHVGLGGIERPPQVRVCVRACVCACVCVCFQFGFVEKVPNGVSLDCVVSRSINSLSLSLSHSLCLCRVFAERSSVCRAAV